MAKILTSLFESPPRRLAELMSLEARPLLEWKLEELPAILKHQWTAPVCPDMALIDPVLAERMGSLNREKGGGWKCFAEILQDPAAPLEALQLLVDYAKASWTHAHCPMPQAIAQVVYYASMARAWSRYHQLIGGLEECQMRRGLEWAMNLPWLDETTRSFFAEAKPVSSHSTSKQTQEGVLRA